MRKSLRVGIATLITGSAFLLSSCEEKTVEAPAEPTIQEDKTAEEAQQEAQDLLDNTVG